MMDNNSRRMNFGVIVGNRGFFPDHLARSGRSEILAVIEKAGYDATAVGPEETKFGAVETRVEAARCADLFKHHRDAIGGVIVTLPNFGDERAIADTLRMADLNVPVLVQATPDTPGHLTVRDSEKILEANGISVEPIDLSEILGRIARMGDQDSAAVAKLESIRRYVSTDQVPIEALLKMAKLGAVIDQWMEQTQVAISAVQCWTSLEEFFGVVPCTVMSMMSENLMSSACEVDICGVVGMHALQLASQTPSALLDWNNDYSDDPAKAVC